ncbi:uncharacterized protein LOC117169568 [Belonocnema kinseyi]|uniref:uncharacterized protein LOC117169568 n=1 Tax=Belonocnema kinseyi TaxID=2817044 RepID=UPI00143DD889|nr:uncharacterized protein LOC117169568 [Belonocnema kinseyi]
MMKFFILAFVALSVDFSECKDVLKEEAIEEAITPEAALKDFFNITKEDMDAKCDKTDEIDDRISKLDEAFSKMNEATINLAMENKKAKQSSAGNYEGYKALCEKNDAFTQAKTNVIKTALPCVTDDKMSELLQFAMTKSCGRLKN